MDHLQIAKDALDKPLSHDSTQVAIAHALIALVEEYRASGMEHMYVDGKRVPVTYQWPKGLELKHDGDNR